MSRKIDPQLPHHFHGERVRFTRRDACRLGEDPTGIKRPYQRLGHGRADRIQVADEEHGAR